jgi:hypothetical protein
MALWANSTRPARPEVAGSTGSRWPLSLRIDLPMFIALDVAARSLALVEHSPFHGRLSVRFECRQFFERFGLKAKMIQTGLVSPSGRRNSRAARLTSIWP